MSPLTQKQFENQATADRFWRSISELSETPDALEQMQQEFPEGPHMALSSLSRRRFTQLMAASIALAGAGISGCRRWPEQTVCPQSERTEGFLPGVPEYFASQFELGGVATGVLVKSQDGRPIKIEGNKQHPFSNGASGVFAQASVLEMYDPDRTRGYIYRPQNAPDVDGHDSKPEKPSQNSREIFENTIKSKYASLRKTGGRGFHVLAQSQSSPTFDRLRREFQLKFPNAQWHVYQPINRDNEFAGTKQAFGRVLRPQFDLQKSKTIVCLDADLLGLHPGHQKWCHDWAAGRNPDSKNYSRMWSFESSYSVTGAAGDVRIPVAPSQMSALLKTIAAEIGIELENALVDLDSQLKEHVHQLGKELKRLGAASLLVAGPSQPVEIHAIVHTINQFLGSVGTTVHYTQEPLAENNSSVESIAVLAGALRNKSVDTLLILDGNPVYDAPSDLRLELQNQRRLTSVYLGLFDNETAQQCTWHAPESHYLEAWNDGRAWDGTYGVGQPIIYPLFDGISQIEMLSLAIGNPVKDGLKLIRETAKQLGVEQEKKWNQLLHDGALPGTQFPLVDLSKLSKKSGSNVAVQQSLDSLVAKQNSQDNVGEKHHHDFEICFVPDASTYDGRFANNGWLQELPDPLTKLTWDNAALISQADAKRHELNNGDVISIKTESEFEIQRIPVLIQPGQAPGSMTLHLGYGRKTGHLGTDVGADVYTIRTSKDFDVVTRAQITPQREHHKLALTQEHHLIDTVGKSGRAKRIGEPAQPGLLVRETTLTKHRQDPHQVHSGFHVPQAAPLFDPPAKFNSPHSWGMSIDLNACVGCNACVVACQSENNIPIVGKANVLQSREMHWLRIDRYFKGDVESPDVVHVPMACAHCEDAPCEQVCPVAATVHDTEGLNAMVYNRCVGTRYCANNCPYKVRRFNYFDYHASNPKTPAKPWLDIPDQQTSKELTELEQMLFNPEVSVRMRGVMEKCTYCVQRISAARIKARNEHAQGERVKPELLDGEVVTACQQACPTQAIRFGDLNQTSSAVCKAHQDARAYSMLEETNIKPRTRYLAKVRNIENNDESTEASHGH